MKDTPCDMENSLYVISYCQLCKDKLTHVFIDSKRIKMEITEKMQFRNGACN